MQCPLLPLGPSICLWTGCAASSPNMKHVQGLIWFASDGLPKRGAIGTVRQPCITSLTAHTPPPLPKQLDSCWYGPQFPVRIHTRALLVSTEHGPHTWAPFLSPTACCNLRNGGDFPCCSSSTGLLCAYAAPTRRYLFSVQHPRDSLVSPALVSMQALSLSSSGQLPTCHRGYQQKWLWDDVKHRCCGRSHSKGGRHRWHHHPRTFKCWGDTGKSHPRGLQIAASHIFGMRLYSHYSISLSSPAEKILPTTL